MNINLSKEQQLESNKYLTVAEVSEILNVSESLIRKLVFTGEIPYIKVRSLIRFREVDIHRWVKEQQEKAEGEL